MHTCKWTTPKKTHKKLDGNIGPHLKKKKKERQKCSNIQYVFHLLGNTILVRLELWD